MITSWRVELVTPPAVEPLTFGDMVEHLRLNSPPVGNEEMLVERFIKAAREEVEKRAGVALLQQTRRLWLDCFPYSQIDSSIYLPYSPVISVSSVKYLDSDGALQTLPSGLESPPLEAEYLTDLISFPARIFPAYGKFWPATRAQINAVQIEYVCGFGDDPADVPQNVLILISRLVGHWYENRESTAPGDVLPKEIDDQMETTIANLRVSHFG